MTRLFHPRRARATAVAALVLAAVLSGCSMLDDDKADTEPSATPTPSAADYAYDSQFTRDGTFQSHIDIDGVDFVYTLYPTKATPRTNEWYPRGNKFFTFTFQAYDLDRGLRDRFATKRKVYLERIRVDSTTITEQGDGGQRPYRLDAVAKRVTFDPEPVTTDKGMIITSPKGAFELRNQRIGEMSPETRGVKLTFVATVWIQDAPGSTRFSKREIRQVVPIGIFESDKPTVAARIPINSN
ncbi:hypothetical protein [Nocardioides sp. cx-173]|uniref:hypothetical protein n=1 Tax=Nocardioides sp. cx-173 TaxID=2898796 RepID=UPI001E2A761B|nr:hypothetical protein [Nocardioides sp. cx-173]MCD4525290.1 hypothetical protein [Nocardioides sp. cx-173]UGB40911.1 hypothetical protein LQ940_16210 [Nocardioides sp. cx-173]